ncbi:hypothetical protein RP726_06445 [Candidatus Methylospira mobilis]|nr:hypothetical protein [Candidatus Methylospira mobilis]WNV06053.1 hypothetical protein RP726_06445 [Candidatus Methylospira mobilis]
MLENLSGVNYVVTTIVTTMVDVIASTAKTIAALFRELAWYPTMAIIRA